MSSPRERTEEVGKKIKREADATGGDRTGGVRRLGAVVAGTLNTITPCAACKLLRRRCAQDCPFSPYFSPHEPQKFASVHKVFGASNVSKMLMEVPEPQRADAANSLVYEANLRLRDPIYGCMGAISALQQQVQALEAELHAVRAEILKHKYRHQQAAGAAFIVPASASSSSHHAAAAAAAAALLASASPDQVSVAAAAPMPPPPPLPPSVLDASSSIFTSLNHSSSASSYSSISTNHNVNSSSYFG